MSAAISARNTFFDLTPFTGKLHHSINVYT